ncbi:MAG TPA: condensation domain-containing protein, partial [Blastocatellia bacterium]
IKGAMLDMVDGDFIRHGSSCSEAATPRAQHTETQPSALSESIRPSSRVPLTEAQTEIWALSKLADELTRAYTVSISLHLRGELDVDALACSLQSVVDRNDSLRASIDATGEFLMISPSLTVDLPVVDLSPLEADEIVEEAERWKQMEASRRFDLEKGPLLAARLLKLGQEEHILILTAHHIICDGWSTGLIVHQLKSFYSARCAGAEPNLLPVGSFAEYALKVSQEAPNNSGAERYWRSTFADGIPGLKLPLDFDRPAGRTFPGGREKSTIPASVAAKLRRVGVSNGCTLFLTLLGCFETMLYHLTANLDIVIGTPSAGRVRQDDQRLVGNCVNLLPLRINIDPDASFASFLASLREGVTEAYDYQDYPFNRLLKSVAGSYDQALSQFLPVIFNLDRGESVDNFHDLKVEVTSNHNGLAKFDVLLEFTDTGSDLHASLEYAADLFSKPTIQSWLAYLEDIIVAVIDDPDVPIESLRPARAGGRSVDQARIER